MFLKKQGSGPFHLIVMSQDHACYLQVLPYEVRLFHWTVVTCKTIFVAVLSGMSALFPKTAPLVIAAITVAHALFTFVWLPFTDFAELLIELLSVSIEALTTVLVAWMSINESLLESDAVDGALVALSMTMLISHMGYQVYMMVVIRMMTQLYKDAQVMTEQKAMEMEKEMREDDAALNEARGGKVATATQVLTAKPLDSKRSKSRWDGVKVEDDDL